MKKDKVLVYLTRQGRHGVELLTFSHKDFPSAGIQVPAGRSHVVSGKGVDQDLIFEFRWRNLSECKSELAGQQGKYIDLLMK